MSVCVFVCVYGLKGRGIKWCKFRYYFGTLPWSLEENLEKV